MALPLQTRAARFQLRRAWPRAVLGCIALCMLADALAAEPDAARPDAARPDAARPDAARPSHDDPRDWLARTDQALSSRNYEGVFVHEHAGESETLRVIHRADSDGVSERLLSMDGSGREFIRRGTQLICYLPDQRTVLVEKGPDSALLLSGLPRIDASSTGQYDVTELARARVSGRAARVVAIAPLDDLRYGYRVWIDEATAMPLKTQLRNTRGDVLEQIVFTSLDMRGHIPKAELEPGVDARDYRWVRRDVDPKDEPGLTVSWEAQALPPGFRMTASARQMLPGGPVEHLVFSDGLASVSVFVDIGPSGDPGTVLEDAATLGTSSAYSTLVQGFRVTAVGEVPPETVRVIAKAIRSPAPAGQLATVSGAATRGTTAPSSAAPSSAAPGAAAPGAAAPGAAALPSAAALPGAAVPPDAAPAAHGFGAEKAAFGNVGPGGGGAGRR